ncbi:MAG: glycoside hydrolase family 25 protein [Clostridia bacterium]|nr:glycoside hydrolase family 25 protein [Clostridia bacterium]
MNLRDKKYIPYYILASVIILSAVFVVVIIDFASDRSEKPPEVIIVTEPEETTRFVNGDVPYYPDIPASAYLHENFVMEDGRIRYLDDTVSYSTGIDVSAFQGDIDWDAVAADGIDFAIIRAGLRGYGAKGSIHEDDNVRKNLAEAADAGLRVGVYFYSQAITVEEAIEEAEFVLDIIKDYQIDAPVVFDWENEPGVGMRTDNLPGNVLTDCAVAFCEKIKDAGYIPCVYFNLTDAYVRYDLDEISDYVFWYAQHEGVAPKFYYQYSIWQYSDSGKVDGIDGYVDLNICFDSVG